MSTSYHTLASSPFDGLILGLILGGFLVVFVMQACLPALAKQRWGRALYVHLMNGFYIDIPARRVTAWFYGQPSPVQ